jgi:hypothetical protein
MPNEIQTSFIPKQTLVQRPAAKSSPIGLMTVVAVFIFFISIATLAGAYLYKQFLYNQINRDCDRSQESTNGCGLVASLSIEEDNLNKPLLTRLRQVDAKNKLAKQIISSHVSVSPIFKLLGENTLTTIQYKRFEYGPTGISIDGVAASYEDIAVQSQAFAARKQEIKSFIFSNLDLDSKGNVNFKLLMTIDPSISSYRLSLTEAQAAQTTETEPVPSAPTEEVDANVNSTTQ